MHKNQNTTDLFFELIRVSIGNAVCLSRTPKVNEWGELYAMAKKQSLVGICFAGVQKLQAQRQAPNSWGNEQGELLYLQWMGMAAKIQQRNEVVNRQCEVLQEKLKADGFRSCILKGQGNASLYNNNLNANLNEGGCSDGELGLRSGLGLLRQPGDIDIWVEGGYKKVSKWLSEQESDCDFDDHHAHLHIFKDTDVEVHFTPYTLRQPFVNRRLQSWFGKNADAQFKNRISLGDAEICAPTSDFNLVYQLTHVYNHFFTEGVGFRQLMDYYFVLRDFNGDKAEIMRVIESLHLRKFAAALMWVIKTVFVGHDKLNDNFLLCKPNEKDGRFLLNEVLQSGNFGKTDKRNKGLYDNVWNRFWIVHMKTFRLWRFDHWAWFWSPICRISAFINNRTR